MTESDPHTFEEKLQACVPMLIEACNAWQANGLIDGPIILACATPRSAQVLCAEGWVDADGVCSREAAAQAVIAAVESGISQAACGTIAAGISLLLGPEGRQRHLEDVTRIRGENQIPILSVLIADAGTMTSFTTGVPRPTVH
jgi:hypothetical protein